MLLFYEVHDFTLIDLLLKWTQSASLFEDIQIEQLFKIIYYMIFNLKHHHSMFSLYNILHFLPELKFISWFTNAGVINKWDMHEIKMY